MTEFNFLSAGGLLVWCQTQIFVELLLFLCLNGAVIWSPYTPKNPEWKLIDSQETNVFNSKTTQESSAVVSTDKVSSSVCF